MGSNPINAHQDWVNRGSWIDPADYDQLIDRLQNTCGTAPTGAIFVSGLIDDNDNATLAWTFHRQGELRVPDLENKQGEIAAPYVLRFVDGAGSVVGESELPLSWTHPDTALALPVTVFGGFAVFPTDTTRIEIWSRLSGKLLASRDITPNRPVIGPPTAVVTTPKVGNRVLEVVWTASDADQDRLTHFLQIAPARSTKFWPVAHAVSNPGVTIELPAGLNRGSYTARVLTSDGVNLVHRDVTFEL